MGSKTINMSLGRLCPGPIGGLAAPGPPASYSSFQI